MRLDPFDAQRGERTPQPAVGLDRGDAVALRRDEQEACRALLRAFTNPVEELGRDDVAVEMPDGKIYCDHYAIGVY